MKSLGEYEPLFIVQHTGFLLMKINSDNDSYHQLSLKSKQKTSGAYSVSVYVML